jgi:predicted RNA-binding Zn ribbon-like protein
VASPAPFLVAGHPALDFLNTIAAPQGETIEFLSDDPAVIAWLDQVALAPEASKAVLRDRPGALAQHARALRESFRTMVERRKLGQTSNLRPLNELLARGGSYSRVEWARGQTPRRLTEWRIRAPQDLLLPLAESMADLLAQGSFELIRECENPACTLWFYDQTKSHQRRWCSMRVCGNRMKVAAFRSREQTGG